MKILQKFLKRKEKHRVEKIPSIFEDINKRCKNPKRLMSLYSLGKIVKIENLESKEN